MCHTHGLGGIRCRAPLQRHHQHGKEGIGGPARTLDDHIRTAWLGHPYYDVINNTGTFREKLHRTVQAVFQRLGLLDPRERLEMVRRRWKLGSLDAVGVQMRCFEVEHVFLRAEGGSRTRLRRRGCDGVFIYTVTTRSTDGSESRRNVQQWEFEVLRAQADPALVTVRKRRSCFVWEDQCFQIDEFVEPHHGLLLMEAHLGREGQPEVPPFVRIESEVTGNPSYTLLNLATPLYCSKETRPAT